MNGDAKKPKVLLPELLPAPSPALEASVRDRVGERARLFVQRFRGLGTTAGAAVLSLHCGGYGVVDPLPPPAQQCSASPDPFTALQADARILAAAGGGITQVELSLFSTYPSAYKGFRIDAVRISGGMLLRIDDVNGSSPAFGGSRFALVIAPDAGASFVDVEVDIGCGAATRTNRYRLTFSGADPVNGPVAVTPRDAVTDGGVSQ